MDTTCIWEEDAEGIWSAGCNNEFVFNSGTPGDNGFEFCPYCGSAIAELPYKDDEEEG